jgi:uncharacterized protein (TIGR03382 family)
MKTKRSNTHRNLGASAFVGLLSLAALPVEAAVIVPNTDMTTGTVIGTLLAIDSPNVASDPRAAVVGFSIVSGTIGHPGSNLTTYWGPNGSATSAAVFTNGGVLAYNFDIPDASIVNAVYTRWVGQGNHTSNAVFSFNEATSGSVSVNMNSNQASNVVIRYTDSLDVARGFGFQKLFGSAITVSGGNGFTVTANASVSGSEANIDSDTDKVMRIDAVIIDYSPIPEPATALLGGLGFLALLRRRRH